MTSQTYLIMFDSSLSTFLTPHTPYSVNDSDEINGEYPNLDEINDVTRALEHEDLFRMRCPRTDTNEELPSAAALREALFAMDKQEDYLVRIEEIDNIRDDSISTASTSSEEDVPLASLRSSKLSDDIPIHHADQQNVLLPPAEIVFSKPGRRGTKVDKSKKAVCSKVKTKKNTRKARKRPSASALRKTLVFPPTPKTPSPRRQIISPPHPPIASPQNGILPTPSTPEHSACPPGSPFSPSSSMSSLPKSEDEEDDLDGDDEYTPHGTESVLKTAGKPTIIMRKGRKGVVGRYGPQRRAQNVNAQQRYRDKVKALRDLYEALMIDVRKILNLTTSPTGFQRAIRAAVGQSVAQLEAVCPQTAWEQAKACASA